MEATAQPLRCGHDAPLLSELITGKNVAEGSTESVEQERRKPEKQKVKNQWYRCKVREKPEHPN
jgi:hypothetical protein